MKRTSSFIAALGIYLALFYFVGVRAIGKALDFAVYKSYSTVIFKGWIQTIAISVVSVILALFVGLILYLMNQSRFSILKYLAEIHKTIIFGTPLLVIAIVSYYYIGFAFNISSKFWVGVITLSLYIGAYIADIYKGAIESIHQTSGKRLNVRLQQVSDLSVYNISASCYDNFAPPCGTVCTNNQGERSLVVYGNQ